MRLAALTFTVAVLLAATATSAVARPCVTAGRVLTHREHLTCQRAVKVARHYFATWRDFGRWDCERVGYSMWFGYCQTRSAYFQWKPVGY